MCRAVHFLTVGATRLPAGTLPSLPSLPSAARLGGSGGSSCLRPRLPAIAAMGCGGMRAARAPTLITSARGTLPCMLQTAPFMMAVLILAVRSALLLLLLLLLLRPTPAARHGAAAPGSRWRVRGGFVGIRCGPSNRHRLAFPNPSHRLPRPVHRLCVARAPLATCDSTDGLLGRAGPGNARQAQACRYK